MPRQKKPKVSQPIEVTSLGDLSLSTTVSTVKDITSQAPPRLAADPGYAVKCGMCGTDIWVGYVSDGLVYICSPCAELLPE